MGQHALGNEIDDFYTGAETKDEHRLERFWKIAGETGNKVILGADAHQPDRVWDPKSITEAEKIEKNII